VAPQLQVMLEDMISGVRDTLRGDIQNLQLDIIRQFHIQQRHTETLCERRPPYNKPCLGSATFFIVRGTMLACVHRPCVVQALHVYVIHCLKNFRRFACSANIC
jgi:hypothetical protein